jgi:alkyl sulfatase BDS1-like metallo-beta-lactamase superfamily hydrolase
MIGLGLDQINHEGDLEALTTILAVIESPDRNFPIVTP